jgi:hypothetical protein
MKKALIILVSTFALASCAGRHANPILATHASDRQMSCSSIQSELETHERTLVNLQLERSRINRTNINMGIAGSFLLVPLFFINVSDAPEVEQYAISGSMNKVNDLSAAKKCN